jgi:3-dehydroquinate synthase
MTTPTHIGDGLLARLPALVPALASAHRVAIVTDANLERHGHLEAACRGFAHRPTCMVLPPGESTKTRDTWARVTDTLLHAGFGRDSALVALGGGMIGDLTGFVAATFQRGIPFVQVPTTLLAMVDAAHGGKTGVDTTHGKNLVGAFHEPAAVIVDLDTWATLPDAERRAGMAEVIKHGVVADADYFARVAEMLPPSRTPFALDAVVRGSIHIKSTIVAQDAREAGVRKVLNFGHTIGHAIEQRAAYQLAHGDCVAIGMVVETRIAVALGLCAPDVLPTLVDTITRAWLPTRVPATIETAAIVAATATDKKARAGRVEYALPRAIGAMAGAERQYGIPVDDDIVRAAIDASR